MNSNAVPLTCPESPVKGCRVTTGERLHPSGRALEEGELSPLSPHRGELDARREGRRALHRRDARAPEAGDHHALHPGLDGEAPGGTRSLSPGGTIAVRSLDARSRLRTIENRVLAGRLR